jgi:hypothetical protein
VCITLLKVPRQAPEKIVQRGQDYKLSSLPGAFLLEPTQVYFTLWLLKIFTVIVFLYHAILSYQS